MYVISSASACLNKGILSELKQIQLNEGQLFLQFGEYIKVFLCVNAKKNIEDWQ